MNPGFEIFLLQISSKVYLKYGVPLKFFGRGLKVPEKGKKFS